MDKEQKKLLLVAVSVGVFLLVTITLALFLITQKTEAQDPAMFAANPVQPAGSVSIPLNTDPVPVVADNPELNSETIPENAEIEETAKNGNGSEIKLPELRTVAVPNNVETKPSVNAAAAVAAAPAAQPETTRSAAATTTAVQLSRTVTSSRTLIDYWIQTGSFNAKIRADDAKELLDSKGFTSIIENREIDGRTWYRVRLGPYTSENEAKYWLALVQAIDGFGESQVWQTTRQQ